MLKQLKPSSKEGIMIEDFQRISENIFKYLWTVSDCGNLVIPIAE